MDIKNTGSMCLKAVVMKIRITPLPTLASPRYFRVLRSLPKPSSFLPSGLKTLGMTFGMKFRTSTDYLHCLIYKQVKLKLLSHCLWQAYLLSAVQFPSPRLATSMLLPKRLLCRGFRRGYHQQALGKL